MANSNSRPLLRWSLFDLIPAVYLGSLVLLMVLRGFPPSGWPLLVAWLLHGALNLRGSGSVGPPSRFRAVRYRFLHFLVIVGTYLFLGAALPVLNPSSHDQALYSLDLWLFGIEPALAWQDWVTPGRTEWFALCYLSYYPILVGHLLGVAIFEKRQDLASEFALGIGLVAVVAQLLYVVVPGFGPYVALATQFTHSLPHGPVFQVLQQLVRLGGAQKDIFPSLHTAFPTYIFLFALRHRSEYPFRWTWPILGFAALNIVISTMFLRWHYLIDIVAGLLLAGTAFASARGLRNWDAERCRAIGRGPGWPEIA